MVAVVVPAGEPVGVTAVSVPVGVVVPPDGVIVAVALPPGKPVGVIVPSSDVALGVGDATPPNKTPGSIKTTKAGARTSEAGVRDISTSLRSVCGFGMKAGSRALNERTDRRGAAAGRSFGSASCLVTRR